MWVREVLEVVVAPQGFVRDSAFTNQRMPLGDVFLGNRGEANELPLFLGLLPGAFPRCSLFDASHRSEGILATLRLSERVFVSGEVWIIGFRRSDLIGNGVAEFWR